MIHYVLERDEEGMPARLVWSSQIQEHAEAQERQRLANEAEKERIANLPMPSMVDWAKKRGLA